MDMDALQAQRLDDDPGGARQGSTEHASRLAGRLPHRILGKLGMPMGFQHNLRLIRPLQQVLGEMQGVFQTGQEFLVGRYCIGTDGDGRGEIRWEAPVFITGARLPNVMV